MSSWRAVSELGEKKGFHSGARGLRLPPLQHVLRVIAHKRRNANRHVIAIFKSVNIDRKGGFPLTAKKRHQVERPKDYSLKLCAKPYVATRWC